MLWRGEPVGKTSCPQIEMHSNISGYSVSFPPIPLVYFITDIALLGCQSNVCYITIRKYCGICCEERNTLSKLQSQFLVDYPLWCKNQNLPVMDISCIWKHTTIRQLALKTVEFILNAHILIKPIHLAASKTNVNTEHGAQKKEQSK